MRQLDFMLSIILYFIHSFVCLLIFTYLFIAYVPHNCTDLLTNHTRTRTYVCVCIIYVDMSCVCACARMFFCVCMLCCVVCVCVCLCCAVCVYVRALVRIAKVSSGGTRHVGIALSNFIR